MMFGFPFITSLVLSVSALIVVSLAVHKGFKARNKLKHAED